jgi:hypothetical protein
MTEVITNAGSTGPLVLALSARKEIGLGRKDEGCRNDRFAGRTERRPAGPAQGRGQLLMGYCAAKAGDAQAADLAANLAREEGVEAELPLTVLAGVADGTKPQVHLPKRVLLLDYRFLELLGPVNGTQIFDKAEPALLAALALDTATEARLRIAAAETALRLNALSPESWPTFTAATNSRAASWPIQRSAAIRCCAAPCCSAAPSCRARPPSRRAWPRPC